MIQINKLTKSYNNEALFSDVTFSIQKGERCGLVGRNGTGKSTLFKLILGAEQSDQGDISYPKNYKISHLEQHISFSKGSVIEECVSSLPPELKDQDYLAKKYLSGLGFSNDDMEKSPKDFSGGYQIRINLVKCLLTQPNLLLLDEPTNYLDIISLRWLSNFLRTFHGELILITHDRYFMDQVITHTVGIHRGMVKKVKGKTTKFYEQVLLEEEIHEKTRLNVEKKRAQLQNFVDKNKAKASKASQAQSKIKQIERLDTSEKLIQEKDIRLNFNYQDIAAKVLLEVSNLSFSYPEKPLLIEDLSFSLNRGEKIAIIGKNGKGKSTLLNIIANELTQNTGEVSFHTSVAKGHLGQTNINRLTKTNSVAQEIGFENADLSTTEVRNICGALMFTGDNADKKISVLSGGEKNRVLMAKIMAKKTNLLLLDEPTNHLDMQSIEILTEEIKSYKGSILLVTHSEELLRKAATKLIVFQNQGVFLFNGNYDEFLEKHGWDEEETLQNKKIEVSQISKKERHQKRKEIIKEKSKLVTPLKKKYDALEKTLFDQEEGLELQNQILEKASETSDKEQIIMASKNIGEIQQKIEQTFEEISSIENEIVDIEARFEKKLREIEES